MASKSHLNTLKPVYAPIPKDFPKIDEWKQAYVDWMHSTIKLATDEQADQVMECRASDWLVCAAVPYQYEDEPEPRGHMFILERAGKQIAVNQKGVIFTKD